MARARHAVDMLLVLPALYLAGLVLSTFLLRIPYPYDLEWMEGGMLVHAWRIQHGLPVYGAPTPDWMPFIYPPGYPAVVAALGTVFGVSAPLGRLVSVAATLASCGALVVVGRRHGGSALGGGFAAAVFLTLYPASGAFYDLIRPDALATALSGWAMVAVLEQDRRWRWVSGLLLALAFTVKHNFAILGLPMAIHVALRHGWREGLQFAAVSALPALAFVGVMQWSSEGHFLPILLQVAPAHPTVYDRAVPGMFLELGREAPGLIVACTVAFLAWTADRLGRGVLVAALVGAGLLWAACFQLETLAAALGYAVGLPRGMASPSGALLLAAGALGAVLGATMVGVPAAVRGRESGWAFAVLLGAVLLWLGAMMRAHHGGFVNVYMPVHFAGCLAGAIAFGWARTRWNGPLVQGLTLALVAGQLWVARDFDPRPWVPAVEDRATGDAFVKLLEACEGPVLSPVSPWLAVLAGHTPSWHIMALADLNHRKGPYRPIGEEVQAAFQEQRWACVLTEGKSVGFGMESTYEMHSRIDTVRERGRAGRATFVPRSGWPARPVLLWTPKE